MHPRDTSTDAHQLQLRLYQRMAPERRGEIAAHLSDDVRSVVRDGIRRRHPDYSDAELSRALITLLFGHDVAHAIWS